jgi:hypothetical protein
MQDDKPIRLHLEVHLALTDMLNELKLREHRKTKRSTTEITMNALVVALLDALVSPEGLDATRQLRRELVLEIINERRSQPKTPEDAADVHSVRELVARGVENLTRQNASNAGTSA